ncbi:uncharacterized protein [Macrobrachium rosenbergii]|uniref:uncharacterized protein n=1 Tax=Macrobrachium rosenbergii TaxID=79674 RepID=UPI0034D59E06
MNGFMESVLSLVRSRHSPGVSVGDDISVRDNNVVVRDCVSGESARFSDSFEQRQLSRSPSEARRQSGAGEKVKNSSPRAGLSSKAQESLSPGGESSKLDSSSKCRKALGSCKSESCKAPEGRGRTSSRSVSPSTRQSSRHHRHRRIVSLESSSRWSSSKHHYLKLSSSDESSSSSSSVSSSSSSSDPPPPPRHRKWDHASRTLEAIF